MRKECGHLSFSPSHLSPSRGVSPEPQLLCLAAGANFAFLRPGLRACISSPGVTYWPYPSLGLSVYFVKWDTLSMSWVSHSSLPAPKAPFAIGRQTYASHLPSRPPSRVRQLPFRAFIWTLLVFLLCAEISLGSRILFLWGVNSRLSSASAPPGELAYHTIIELFRIHLRALQTG